MTITDNDVPHRMVITLTGDAVDAIRRLGARFDINGPEAVRRGLSLLDLMASLNEDEELVIRNRKTKEWDRLRFHWGY